MNREYLSPADFFRADDDYTSYFGSVEQVFDYIAVFENGRLYRDIDRMRDREAHYTELCA